MPPLQIDPPLSEQAAFAKHLFIQGYPLWNPDPVLLPQSLQRIGLRIGDVGTVDERGRFDVFFNILDPTPSSSEMQTSFPPIEENDVRCSSDDISLREVVSSPETSWDVEQLEVETVNGTTRKLTQYSATLSDDGAHVILPQGAQLFELGLEHRRLFEDYAKDHGAGWLRRFQNRLGWPRSNSIYLLTGYYKTCSWSIAAFGMKAAANTNPVGVYCTLTEVDERVIQNDSVWHPSGRFKRKIGPAPDRQGQNNQTVFIKGITITPNSYESEPREKQAGLVAALSGPTRFLSTLIGGSTRNTTTEAPKSEVTIQHVPKISQMTHPSEIINLYLLTKAPSARIAVTHDSQWITMLKMLEDGKLSTLDDLQRHLGSFVHEHHHIVTYNDTVYLREKERVSSTSSNNDQSHLLEYLAGDIASGKEHDTKDPSAIDHRSISHSQHVLSPILSDNPAHLHRASDSNVTDASPSNTFYDSSSSRRFDDPQLVFDLDEFSFPQWLNDQYVSPLESSSPVPIRATESNLKTPPAIGPYGSNAYPQTASFSPSDFGPLDDLDPVEISDGYLSSPNLSVTSISPALSTSELASRLSHYTPTTSRSRLPLSENSGDDRDASMRGRKKSLLDDPPKDLKSSAAPPLKLVKPPKLAPSAWQLYFSDWIQRRQATSTRKLNVAQAAKEAGQEYANLTAEEKEPYKQRSRVLKQERERENAAYIRTLTHEDIKRENAFRTAQRKAGRSRKGNLKDPNAPKKPLSAYFMYLQRIRSDPLLVKEIFGNEQDTIKQSVLAAAKWRSMTDDERKPFLAQAELEKSEYEAARRRYEKKPSILPGSPSEFRTHRATKSGSFSSESENDVTSLGP